LDKLDGDHHDFTEQLGELTLRQIQIVKDKSRRLFPIYPDTVFKSFWDFVAMSFICYHAIVIPYRYCFKARAFGWLRVFEFLVDIFFIIDLCKLHYVIWLLVLNFVTGYYKRGNLMMKRGPIMKRYLRTWFLFDFIATIPVTWFIPERNVDYWPDDDFDETAALKDEKGDIFEGLRQLLETDRLVTTLADFDPAQTMRLLKLARFVRVIKIN